MSKRRRKSRRSTRSASSEYRSGIAEADRILREKQIVIAEHNWQQVTVETLTLPDSPDRVELTRYIAAHADQLGVAWAREMVRLEIFFQVDDHAQVVAHYDRALARYPRCAVIEIWVADQVFHHLGDFWRAREMYLYQVEVLPHYAKPRYELGFMHHLLGDHVAALRWFDEAAPLLPKDDKNLGAQLYLNRGLIRYLVQGDRERALADIREALRRRPDYPQARQSLRALKAQGRRGLL